MSINKILLAMALGLALTACSNQEPAADAAAPAADAAAADAANGIRAPVAGARATHDFNALDGIKRQGFPGENAGAQRRRAFVARVCRPARHRLLSAAKGA